MIYLDNAATSLRKPPDVMRAVEAALRNGGNAGRGANGVSGYASDIIFECRKLAGALFGFENIENIAFTLNATHALNIAINSLVRELGRKKDRLRAVISGYEHNAVYRPLMALEEKVDTQVVASPLFEPEVFLHKLEDALRQGADLVVCTHVSNVFGYILPVDRIDALCEKYGVPLIIDASQSAGCLPIDMSAFRAVRFVCMPGHKGLYGPQGTGIIISTGEVEPLIHGGTGTDSRNAAMPEYLPERLEAGTQNLPGIAGLCEGIRFVARMGVDKILEHERNLISLIAAELDVFPNIKLYMAEKLFCQTGVLSVGFREDDPEKVAEVLDRRGIALRAGLHCAPLAHGSAGTLDGGTLRISPSAFTTQREAGMFVRELRRVIQGR